MVYAVMQKIGGIFQEIGRFEWDRKGRVHPKSTEDNVKRVPLNPIGWAQCEFRQLRHGERWYLRYYDTDEKKWFDYEKIR